MVNKINVWVNIIHLTQSPINTKKSPNVSRLGFRLAAFS